ncbi:uncharacterized protein LOC118419478 isoform X3 [Branchiostoma floridae]|nr:uncharacterized protein LOC118419478 isoform X3 [Branchiostoma floridae]
MLRRLERQASDRALGGTVNDNLGKSVSPVVYLLQGTGGDRQRQPREVSLLLLFTCYRAPGGTVNDNLGKYGGLKMDSLKHEVDQMLKDMDPGVRRAKRARKLLEKGRRDGRIRPYDMHSVCLPPIVADTHDEIDIVTAAQEGGPAAGEKGPTAEPNRTRLPPLRTLKASVGIDDSDDDL